MTAALPHVPVLDRAHLVGRLLESLLAQDYPHERYDTTVVDNGSSDGTPRVVARYQTLERRPSWMRPASRFDAIAMWLLEGVVKIAYDRGIRRGRRNREVILGA